MRITLVDFTGAGTEDPAKYAAARLIFAKSTRLNMSPDLLEEIETFEEHDVELAYIANTIPSSWEFVNYSFLIENVSRAFTHQLVRTRHASFAQQTMRVLNKKGWTYHTGPSIAKNPIHIAVYKDQMDMIADTYDAMIENGAEIEDARGILPTNIHTNILMACNLRTFVETVRKRSSPRVQGEYREFLDLATQAVREVHPFIDLFLARTADKAAAELNEMIMGLGAGDRPTKEKQMHMVKLLDQVRQNG